MEEIKEFLIEKERFDLLAILMTFMDEVDSDYEPPQTPRPEPREEYIEEGDPEDIDVGQTDDGFYFLK